jgi:hypothetical protein
MNRTRKKRCSDARLAAVFIAAKGGLGAQKWGKSWGTAESSCADREQRRAF